MEITYIFSLPFECIQHSKCQTWLQSPNKPKVVVHFHWQIKPRGHCLRMGRHWRGGGGGSFPLLLSFKFRFSKASRTSKGIISIQSLTPKSAMSPSSSLSEDELSSPTKVDRRTEPSILTIMKIQFWIYTTLFFPRTPYFVTSNYPYGISVTWRCLLL